MAGLQCFNEQDRRIKNTEYDEITSEEGKDAVITGLFKEHFEQNLTGSDEDLVDVLVNLGKKNRIVNIDINEGLNVSNVGVKFPKIVPLKSDQNKNVLINNWSASEKKFRGYRFLYLRWSFKTIFCSKTVFNQSKKILSEAQIKVLDKGLDFAPI